MKLATKLFPTINNGRNVQENNTSNKEINQLTTITHLSKEIKKTNQTNRNPIITTKENDSPININKNQSFNYTNNQSKTLDFPDILIFIISILAILIILKFINKEKENVCKEDVPSSNQKSIYKQILTRKYINFFTNLKSMELFTFLHDFMSPFVVRRFGTQSVKRTFKGIPKKFGRERKLCSKDEFLLMLLKLRLGLLNKDLAQRFNISVGLVSKNFHSWLRSSAEVLKYFIFIPAPGTFFVTTPKRFKNFKKLVAIIDCIEIFIETPKDLELQSAT